MRKKFIHFKLDHLKKKYRIMHRHVQTKPRVMITQVLSEPSAMLATKKVPCEEAGTKIGTVI